MEAVDYLRKRTQAELTQTEISQRTGFSRTTVIHVETGQRVGSTRYKTAFLRAVSGDYIGQHSGLTRFPVERTKKLASNAHVALEAALVQLEGRLRSLDKAKKAVGKLSEQIKQATDDIAIYSEEKFDPLTARDEDLYVVGDHMCKVFVQMMVDHNFHILSDEQIGSYLSEWTKKILQDVRKARNRHSLQKFSID